MGTPNVNRQQLIVELTRILRRPEYTLLLRTAMEDNRFYAEKAMRRDKLARQQTLLATGIGTQKMKFDAGPLTPAEFAEAAVDSAFGPHNKPSMLDPIQVTEIVGGQKGAVHLYRVYDGNTAGTLGRWWCDASLLREIVGQVGDVSKAAAQQEVIDWALKAMFVHPLWNGGKEIARLTVAEGVSLPAIVGRGSWKAMKSPESKKYPAIQTAADLLDSYGIVGIPGPQQTFVPLVPGMRVTTIPRASRGWPFYFEHEMK